MSDEQQGPQFNPQSGYPVPPPDPRQPYQQPQYQQPQYQQPYQGYPSYYNYPPAPPELPRANTALVLGIVSLAGGFSCLLPILASPFAWWTGARAKREIRESGGRYGGEGKANAGMVMGIIGTVLLALGILGLIVIIAIGASGGFDEGETSGFGEAAVGLLGG